MTTATDTATGESRPTGTAAGGPAPEVAPADESTGGLIKLFFATLFPDLSIKGLVYGIVLIVLIGFGGIIVAGKFRKAPSSPFRCDDPALQARLGKNLLPTVPYLAATAVVSVAAIFIVEFCGRTYSRKSEATYWTARHVQRYLVGGLILGCSAHGLQVVINAKRPYFIDACQPAITFANGTEFLVCSGEQARAATSRGFEEDPREAEAVVIKLVQTLARWINWWRRSGDDGSPVLAVPDSTPDVDGALVPSTKRVAGREMTVYEEQSDVSGDDGPGGSRSDSLPVFDDAIRIATVVEGDITDYNCTGPQAKKSGASFPSGHASVASFASAFMFGYCFRRCCNCDKPLGVLVLALVTAAHAVLVCVQRYAQNFHHLVDLGAGVGVGVVVALPFVLWPYGEAPAWLAGGSGQAAPR